MHNNKAGHRREVPRLSYKDIKRIIERRLAQQTCGLLTEHKISHLIKDCEDQREEEELDTIAIKCEVRRLE